MRGWIWCVLWPTGVFVIDVRICDFANVFEAVIWINAFKTNGEMCNCENNIFTNRCSLETFPSFLNQSTISIKVGMNSFVSHFLHFWAIISCASMCRLIVAGNFIKWNETLGFSPISPIAVFENHQVAITFSGNIYVCKWFSSNLISFKLETSTCHCDWFVVRSRRLSCC